MRALRGGALVCAVCCRPALYSLSLPVIASICMKKRVQAGGLILLFLVFGINTAAVADKLPLAEEFTARLGWLPADAHQWLGGPENLFVYRGRVSEEDNVVYYYPDHVYLFWFRNRVWQVRADEDWTGSVDGVRMGMSREEVEKLWGPPINNFDAQPTWTLPDRGYPVRIRLYFNEDNRLHDLYVFRSDW